MSFERPELGHLEDLVTTLGSSDRSLAKLVEIERFRVSSESGIDPLAHTPYAGDDEDDEPDFPPWVSRDEDE